MSEVQKLEPTEPKAAPQAVETVSIPKEQLDALLGRIQKLEEVGVLGVDKSIPVKSKYRQAKVRFIDGNVVVKYGKSWDIRTEDGDWVLMQKVYVQDAKGKEVEHSVPAIQFRNDGEQMVGDIISVKEEYKESSQGRVQRKELGRDGWNMVDTDEFVELIVRVPNFYYTIRLEDGREFTLHQSVIN